MVIYHFTQYRFGIEFMPAWWLDHQRIRPVLSGTQNYSPEAEKQPVIGVKPFECPHGCVAYICIDKRETRPFFRYPGGWGSLKGLYLLLDTSSSPPGVLMARAGAGPTVNRYQDTQPITCGPVRSPADDLRAGAGSCSLSVTNCTRSTGSHS